MGPEEKTSALKQNEAPEYAQKKRPQPKLPPRPQKQKSVAEQIETEVLAELETLFKELQGANVIVNAPDGEPREYFRSKTRRAVI